MFLKVSGDGMSGPVIDGDIPVVQVGGSFWIKDQQIEDRGKEGRVELVEGITSYYI